MTNNVFKTRTLNQDEKDKIKKVVEEGAKFLLTISTEKEALKDLVGNLVEELNENVTDKSLKIGKRTINAMIKECYEAKLPEEKDKLAEIEDGLVEIGLG